MSDDECDIFNLPPKQNIAVPQKLFVPEGDLSQTDYNFITTSKAVVKKPAKVSKTKKTAQKKTDKQQKTGTDEGKSDNIGLQEQDSPTTTTLSTANPAVTRELSPVSKLILEMEERQSNEINQLPVARRTRSSMGERKEPDVVVASVLPPKRRNVRGRKKTGPAASTIDPHWSIAERAARAQVIDSIDMVSAVVPRIEGFVNLDSDDDGDQLLDQAKEPTPANNFDDDNQILDINLNWFGEIQLYKLRQHQKFAHMFKEVSKRNNVPIDDIIINMEDIFIRPTESPQNVGLKVYHILSGHAMKSAKNVVQHKEDDNNMVKPKKFQLKVQGDKWKKPLIIQLKKTDTFKILYIKCAEEMECAVSDFKLFFDGELLEPDDTPKNQDMEGNEMIDLRSK
ncbi:uncharacterized protein CG4449 [Drosophila grimshawi]|uniref:GH21394 n=1 Tax=Drosophila grimshawi TaxID=7222 RepID=B4JRT3_DROGR|nr:uncharacterized protein CG4449 [Drosophila grimshawi]EDV94473.1 GH21394 [Drosophila grimshawi]